MEDKVTADQVIEAAKALGTDEFNREQLAGKIGVNKPFIRAGFKEARHAGRLEKVRDDEEGTSWFKLT